MLCCHKFMLCVDIDIVPIAIALRVYEIGRPSAERCMSSVTHYIL